MSSSDQLDPINNPQDWDVIYVAQTPSPGVCKLGEWKRAFEWDVKKGKGTLGATVTFVGRPPAKGSITFYLWLPEHFSDWKTFRDLLKFDPTKQTVQAIDMFHPSLGDIGIHSVVTESIGNIVHEGQQLYSITVEFLEYFAPPKAAAVGTPTGSTSTTATGAPGSPPDPVADAQQKEIGQLLAKATQP